MLVFIHISLNLSSNVRYKLFLYMRDITQPNPHRILEHSAFSQN